MTVFTKSYSVGIPLLLALVAAGCGGEEAPLTDPTIVPFAGGSPTATASATPEGETPTWGASPSPTASAAEPSSAPTPTPAFTPTEAAFTATEIPSTPARTPTETPADEDGDGYPASEDCDDADPAVHPGAEERCDGVDNSCDGRVDEADPALVDGASWYPDADGDGFGDAAAEPITSCQAPPGYVAEGGDCDDADAEVSPAAVEVCGDDVDRNCDGSVGFDDADGDGAAACEDCDDASPASYPGAPEVCDGRDNDCDGAADEGATSAFFLDADRDGWGDDSTEAQACAPPTSVYVAAGGDCDDLDPRLHPEAEERCDDADQDCDGAVDEDAVDAPAFVPDGDGDGYGDPAGMVAACISGGAGYPQGHISAGGPADCDDDEPGRHPGADETCDQIDQDCDGAVDEGAVDLQVFYPDADGDGYGQGEGTEPRCTPPAEGRWATRDGDCDDARPGVNAGAVEICDGEDNNCDALVDDEDPSVDLATAPTWFPDGDHDGFGVTEDGEAACAPPRFFVAEGGDCDDADPGAHPGGEEVCDEADGDCDGQVDEGAPPTAARCPASSCADIHDAWPQLGDGAYWVRLPGAEDATQALCDMSTDGGGWTVVGRASDTNGAGGDYEFRAAVGEHSLLSVGFAAGEPDDPQYLQDLSRVLDPERGDVEVQYYCYDPRARADTAYWLKASAVDAGALLAAVDTSNPDFLWSFTALQNKDGVTTSSGYFAFFARGGTGSHSCGNSYAGQSGMKFSCSRSGQTSNDPHIVWYLTHHTGNYTEVSSCGPVYGSVLPYYRGEIRIR